MKLVGVVLLCACAVSPLPVADFVVAGCSFYGNCITADASPSVSAIRYNWSWGDGTVTSTSRFITDHYYPRSVSDYMITLEVIDRNGARATASKILVGVGSERWKSP